MVSEVLITCMETEEDVVWAERGREADIVEKQTVIVLPTITFLKAKAVIWKLSKF
jgi:hypothetical protein